MKISCNPLTPLVLIIFLSITHAYGDSAPKDVSKRYAKKAEQHHFQDIGKCDRKFFKRFSKVVMSSNCMPRPSVVQLIPASPEILLVPSKVVVDRCAGECHAKLSCMATNMTKMPVEVEQLNVLDDAGGVKCGIVNVEVHTRCHCECTVMEHHCNSKQLYFPRKCMCLCMNDDERKLCSSQGGEKFWNSDTCRCECHTQRECTTGLIWIPELCSCAKLMPEDNNSIDGSF